MVVLRVHCRRKVLTGQLSSFLQEHPRHGKEYFRVFSVEVGTWSVRREQNNPRVATASLCLMKEVLD